METRSRQGGWRLQEEDFSRTAATGFRWRRQHRLEVGVERRQEWWARHLPYSSLPRSRAPLHPPAVRIGCEAAAGPGDTQNLGGSLPGYMQQVQGHRGKASYADVASSYFSFLL